MASSNKKHKFKKYVGRLPAVPSFDSSDSLDKTEMRLLAAAESSASDGQNVEPNNMQMPLSCQSLLKVFDFLHFSSRKFEVFYCYLKMLQ